MSSTTSLARQLFRTRYFTAGTPSKFTISPDGGRVLFLRSRGAEEMTGCLWELDLATGKERLLADSETMLGGGAENVPEEEKVRRERSRQRGGGIVDYTTDRELRVAAFALSGDVWVVDVVSGAVTRLTRRGDVVDPRMDPTGQRVAYVAQGALRVAGLDGADRALAEPEAAEVTYGLAEHVAAESMARHRGYWWAPDGRRLIVARVDNGPVDVWYISDPADPAKRPREFRYPGAGGVNAGVTLWIVDVEGGRTPVGFGSAVFEYVPFAGWDGHGPFATVQTRDQQTVQAFAIDPDDGSTTLLAEQRDECWVDLIRGLPARTASGALIWYVQSGQTTHLAVGGQPVTPAGLQIMEVLGVDGEEIFFVATAEPTERHLHLYSAAAGLRTLTSEAGVHTGVYRAGTLVRTSRTMAQVSPQTTAGPVGEAGTPVSGFPHRAVLMPRGTMLNLGERQLRAQLFLPSWHEPGSGKLPVLLDPYGGSAAVKVLAANTPGSFVSRWFAEQGYAVLVIDGSGTPGRGPAWDREVYGDLYTRVLDDQVDGLREAARRYPDLDLGRVAIRGWSFGGSLAAVAVLRRPDVFHAAVSGAGVHNARLYDTHWKERFLGHPDEFPERYDAASLLAEAPKLSRPLLLVHGMADDNVFPANSLQLSMALLAAGKPHEVLPLTGITHMGSSSKVSENMLLHELDFLRRSLPAAEL